MLAQQRRWAAQRAAPSATSRTAKAMHGRTGSSQGSTAGSLWPTGSVGWPGGPAGQQPFLRRAMAGPRTAAQPWLRLLQQLPRPCGPTGVLARVLMLVSHHFNAALVPSSFDRILMSFQ